MKEDIKLTNIIHILLCDRSHEDAMEKLLSSGRDEETCYYYLEENLAECWELADHRHWLEQARKIKNDLKASSESEALRSIYKILDLIENVNNLSEEEYKLFIQFLQPPSFF